MSKFRLKRDIFGDYVEKDDTEAFFGCFALLMLVPIIMLSPVSVIAFFCQRIYISIYIIRRVLRLSAFIVVVCSVIGAVCLLYHWITWDDIYHFLDRRNDESKPLRNWTFILTYSVIAWAIMFVIGLLHLLFSYLTYQWAEGSGYGLLNIHCLITRKPPSAFLTGLQDVVLCVTTFHFSVVGTNSDRVALIGSFLVLVLPTLMANKIFRC